MGNPPKTETADETAGGGRERRKQERFACKGFAEVVLQEVAFLFRGTIRDLSLTGCYIQSSARLMLDPGAAVELRFSVNRDELLLPARVVSIRRGSGAAFEFFEIKSEMQSRLASLIFRLANPEGEKLALAGSDVGESVAASRVAGDLWH